MDDIFSFILAVPVFLEDSLKCFPAGNFYRGSRILTSAN